MKVFVVILRTEDDSNSYLVRGVRTTQGAIKKLTRHLKERDKAVWWLPAHTYAYELNMKNDIIPL